MSESFAGQKLSGERLERAQKTLDATAAAEHTKEAASLAEEIITWLTSSWAERGFTHPQAVFSIALATINLRETYPAGKDEFDAIASQARAYYDQHKDE